MDKQSQADNAAQTNFDTHADTSRHTDRQTDKLMQADRHTHAQF